MDARSPTDIVPTRLTLRQLFYFVIVAEELNFHRAAARLHVSQPPLTQRIQAMERDLGVRLFTRTGKQIELTEAGRVVLAEAKSTLALANRVWEMARRARQGEIGNLRVSVVISASFVRAFSEATEAFQRDYPGVFLDLDHHTTSRNAIEALQQRKIDICVIRRAELQWDGTEQMVIAHDRLMLVLPSNHPQARAEKIALRSIVEERFIPQKGFLFKQTEKLWTRSGLMPRIGRKADTGLAALALVAAGFGNTILPSTLGAIQMPNVVWKTIDTDEQWTSSSIVMLYRTDAHNAKVQSRFVDYVRRFSAVSHSP